MVEHPVEAVAETVSQGTRRYIFAGYLFDGSGGPVRQRVLLGLDGDRIVSMEELEPGLALPPDCLDLSHCTLLPPLVDAHLHLFMSGSSDQQLRRDQLTADYEQLCPFIRRHQQDLFNHGVLAFRDGGDRGDFVLRYRQEQAERIPFALVMVMGRALHRAGRYGRLIGRAVAEDGQPAALIDASFPGDGIKLVNSGLNSLSEFGKQTAPQFSQEEIEALVKRGLNHGLKVMVHANGVEPVRRAVAGGCHSVEHGFFMGRENLQLMAEKGTFWVPTVVTMAAYGRYYSSLSGGGGELAFPGDASVIAANVEHQLELLGAARELGVKVALGTDSGSLGVLHGESVAEELKLYQAAGYSLGEALQCATSRGAELLGLEDYGLLAVGRKATFLVARGTPPQLLRKIRYLEDIWVDGAPSPFYRKNPVRGPVLRR